MENTQLQPIEDEISLKELIQKLRDAVNFLWGHKFKILAISALGGVFGFIYALNKKTTYTSKLVFVTAESDGGGIGQLGAIGSQFGIDLGGGSSNAFGGNNILELMKSRRLIEETLFDTFVFENQKHRILEYYLLRDSLVTSKTPKVDFSSVYNREACNFKQDSVLASVYERITKKALSVSEVDKKLAFKKVELTDFDPVFAKCFVESLTEKVTTFYLETKTKRARDNIKILERKADSVERELQGKMVSAAVAKDQSQFIVNTRALVPSVKRQMEVQLLSTMYGEVVKNLELSKTMSAYNEPLIQVIDRPRFPLEEKKSSKLLGLVLGGFLGFFVTALWLLGKRFFNGLMSA